ncbi:hypothetical protein GVAV_001215 [Gurleya vavrai]
MLLDENDPKDYKFNTTNVDYWFCVKLFGKINIKERLLNDIVKIISRSTEKNILSRQSKLVMECHIDNVLDIIYQNGLKDVKIILKKCIFLRDLLIKEHNFGKKYYHLALNSLIKKLKSINFDKKLFKNDKIIIKEKDLFFKYGDKLLITMMTNVKEYFKNKRLQQIIYFFSYDVWLKQRSNKNYIAIDLNERFSVSIYIKNQSNFNNEENNAASLNFKQVCDIFLNPENKLNNLKKLFLKKFQTTLDNMHASFTNFAIFEDKINLTNLVKNECIETFKMSVLNLIYLITTIDPKNNLYEKYNYFKSKNIKIMEDYKSLNILDFKLINCIHLINEPSNSLNYIFEQIFIEILDSVSDFKKDLLNGCNSFYKILSKFQYIISNSYLITDNRQKTSNAIYTNEDLILIDKALKICNYANYSGDLNKINETLKKCIELRRSLIN